MLDDFPSLNEPMQSFPYPGDVCLRGRYQGAFPLDFRALLPSKEIKIQRMQISHLKTPYAGGQVAC